MTSDKTVTKVAYVKRGAKDSLAALAHLSEHGYEVVQMTSDDNDVDADLIGANADVLLLDTDTASPQDIETVRRLRDRADDLRVLILADRSSASTVVDLIKSGASDLLIKPVEGSFLVAKIESATRDRRDQSEQRRQMSDTFQAVLNALPDGMLKIDRLGTVLEYKEGDNVVPTPPIGGAVGANLNELFPRDLADQLRLCVSRALIDREMVAIEYPLRHSSGSMVFEARIVACGDDSVMFLVRNITERKRSEESLRKAYDELEYRVEERTAELAAANQRLREMQLQLVQTEKMAALTSLVAGVAHELNTPVGIVISNLDLLERAMEKLSTKLSAGVDGLPDCKRELTALKHSGQSTNEATRRISEVVARLSAFVRLDAPELEFIDIHTGIEAALALTDHLRSERIQVVRQYHEIPKVWCYSSRLNYAFMNVMSNAINAIGGNGTITITTERTDEGVRIGVTDTGVGIAKEKLTTIFDPSFSKAGKRVRAGLGLPIVYSCVKEHGGNVEIDTEPGRGTTIWITLPTKPPGPLMSP